MEVNGTIHTSAALSPGDRASVTQWIGGWISLERNLRKPLEKSESGQIEPWTSFQFKGGMLATKKRYPVE
jgi:hypothetical protein